MDRNKKGWPWPGNWKVVCDVCGFQFPSSRVKKRWDGLMVCEDDWETRHPQTLYNYKSHDSVPTFVRPEPEEDFIQVCDITASSGYVGLAEAGCAQAGNNQFTYEFLLEFYTNGH